MNAPAGSSRRTAAQFEAAAAASVPPAAWEYLQTGAGDEITLAEAEKAWRSYRLRPRPFRDVTSPSTATRLLGSALAAPILVAPTAYHGAYHPLGEVATALGVAGAGALMCLSTRSSNRLEEVADVAGDWWMQIYQMRDRRVSDAVADRAVAAGATALVLTVDTPYVHRRTRGAGVPVSEADAVLNVREHLQDAKPDALHQDPAVTAKDITRLAVRTGLPVVAKGVLRGDAAVECVEAGAAAVVVSAHGGRQLDRCVPSAWALPEVVDAVGDQVPILVDGGIRSGLDVLTALALGADAVSLGRPVVHALACDGSAGVRELLEGLHAELAQGMALIGAATVDQIDRSMVMPAAAPRW